MFRRLTRATHHRRLILWLLVIVFVVPLVFFFHAGLNTRNQDGSVAGTIYGRPVPWQTFEEEYRWLRRSMESQLGELAEFFEPYLREQTWDRLLLKEEARRRIKVSDKDLADFIQREPTFQQNGRFDSDLYRRFIQASGTTPRVFEARLRGDLQLQRLVDSMNAQVTISDQDIREAYAKEFNRIKAVLIVVEPRTLESQLTPLLTAEQIRQAYDGNLEAVRIPARRAFQYLGLTIEEARQRVEPITEEDIRAAYDSRLDEFTAEDGTVTPLEQLHETLRQDLLGQRARTILRETTLDLQEDVDAGRTLQEIAKARSLPIRVVGPYEVTVSNLPEWLTPSMLKAAFEVPIGETSDVFSTPTSVYVMSPASETPSRIPPFEEVAGRAQQLALDAFSREAAAARAAQLHAELMALTDAGLRAEEILRVLNVTPLRPAPFTRTAPVDTLGPQPTLAEQLFGMGPGRWSDLIKIARGWVIGFVEEILPFEEAQFQQVGSSFREKVLSLKQQEHLSSWIGQLRTQAHLTSFLEQTK